MSSSIETIHPDVGCANNIAIIESALRSRFGFDDNSHVMTAVAAHIWSRICCKAEKHWGVAEVREALDAVRGRLDALGEKLATAE